MNTIKEQAITLWQDGNKTVEISKRLGVSQSTVSRWTRGVEMTGIRKELHTRKIDAIRLRREGNSPLEISRIIGVPKGTVVHWVKNVVLTVDQRNDLQKRKLDGSRKGCSKGSKVFKKKRDALHCTWMEDGEHRAARDEQFRIVCALYWGEGGKRRPFFAITNADVQLLNVVASWLVENGYTYKLQIRCHSDKDPERARAYWAQRLIGLKPENIYRVGIQDVASVPLHNRRLEYGCAQLQVGNVELYWNIMGGINHLMKIYAGKLCGQN